MKNRFFVPSPTPRVTQGCLRQVLLSLTMMSGLAGAVSHGVIQQPAVVSAKQSTTGSGNAAHSKTSVPLAPNMNILRRTWQRTVTAPLGLQGVFNAYATQLIGQGFGTPKQGTQARAATLSGTFTRSGKRVLLTVRSLGKHRYTVMIQPRG